MKTYKIVGNIFLDEIVVLKKILAVIQEEKKIGWFLLIRLSASHPIL